jgi:hypothetical protein
MRNYWKRRKVQKPLSRKLSLGRRGGAVNSKKTMCTRCRSVRPGKAKIFCIINDNKRLCSTHRIHVWYIC